jgi:hypothetical protein
MEGRIAVRRIYLVFFATLALMVTSAMPVTVAAVGDVEVAVSCSDGDGFSVTVDPQTLIQLKDAVEAMTLYPAGLSCGLTETPLGGLFGAGVALAGNPHTDYAVGGGQGTFPCFPGPGMGHQSFALNAHVNNDALTVGVGGTFNTTVPEQAGCTEQGTLVSKVDCVEVTGNHAELTATVTKATGSWADGGVQPGDELAISATDNSPLTDTLQASFATGPCAFFGSVFEVPISRGNINVHDAP